ncbi:acyltransferase [Enterobacter roggenkampii]|uniref:acyltransferase family protein n=1 Tax=Enterobacter roggenkampii TaxID=1812935 RepID=UPI002FFC0FE7
MKYFPSASGIRGIAVLLVLFAHSFVLYYPEHSDYMRGSGKVGVWLFFILSAFLLSHKLNGIDLTPRSLASYLIGRFLRILPMFIIAVSIYYFMGYYDFQKMIDISIFRDTFFHLWTIPVEFKFYFFLPIVSYAFFYAQRKFGNIAVIIASGIFIWVIQLLWPYYMTPSNSIDVTWYVPCFLLGVVGSVIYMDIQNLLTVRLVNTISAMSIFIILMFYPSVRNLLTGGDSRADITNMFIPIGLVWTIFVVACISGRGLLGSLLQNVIIRKVGEWSFSIYLFHFIALSTLSQFEFGKPVSVFITILASILIGAIAFYLIESRIEKVRAKIAKLM